MPMIWNGTINVTLEDEQNDQLLSLNVDNVCYFELAKKRILAHTLTSTYHTPWNSMKVLFAMLHVSCNFFERVDKAYIVNIHTIRRIDWELGIIFFKEQEDETIKHCFIAASSIPDLRKRLKLLNTNFIF
jgi:DNA-binding LytR/AlgR family response regulator